MKILTWNVEWASPRSPKWKRIYQKVSQHAPDVIVLTEAHEGSFLDGYSIAADPDYGYPKQRDTSQGDYLEPH